CWLKRSNSLSISPASEQPDGGGVRHSILEPKVEKAHEREAVADQELGLLVGEIVEALQHHDFELQDRVVGLAAGVALALLGLRLRHGLDGGAESLPRHGRLDRLQRITLGAQRIEPPLEIVKTHLTHDPPALLGPSRTVSPNLISETSARAYFSRCPQVYNLTKAFKIPALFFDSEETKRKISELEGKAAGMKAVARRKRD